MKEYILVSACLLGRNTKYNGKNNLVDNIEALKSKYNILPICPEVSGGLPIPRLPSEVSIDRVISSLGDDVTINFYKGANITLKLALKYHVTFAILKDGSPSCGSSYIYDGTFTHTKINKMGITAKLLASNNIAIYTENDIEKLLQK